jgi:imidazolonepropionase-like amidohydrolase
LPNKVALGNNYGNPGIELGMPVRGLELMEEAGMTPMQIIVAGTAHSTYVSNLGGEVGTLETGRIADVLVVEGDPSRDIHALANVWLVVKDGVVIRMPLPATATTPGNCEPSVSRL